MTKKFLAAVALSTAPLLWPLAASAGILLTANGTTLCSGPSGTACIAPTTTLADGVIVSGGSNSNSPGSAVQADLFSSTVTISNPTSSTQTVTSRRRHQLYGSDSSARFTCSYEQYRRLREYGFRWQRVVLS